MSEALIEQLQPQPVATKLQADFGPVPTELMMWFRPDNFHYMKEIARVFASSSLVPNHFKDNAPNCMLAISFAFRMGLDPFVALQNLYVVRGNLSMSAQLMIALANRSGVFDGPIVFVPHGENENLSVTAKAKLKHTGDDVSETVSLKQAEEMEWTKNSQLWKGRPQTMLSYRAATALIRLYCPEVTNGLVTKEEAFDDLGDGIEAQPSALASLGFPPKVDVVEDAQTPVEEAPKSTKAPKRQSKKSSQPAPEASTAKPAPESGKTADPAATTADEVHDTQDDGGWDV